MQILQYLLETGMLNSEPMTVLDVGARSANIGRWRAFGQNLRYFGFEPDEEECNFLNDAACHKQVPWEERYFPIALGKENEQRTLYITKKPQCSSLLEPNIENLDGFPFVDHLAMKRTAIVNSYSLSQWVDMHSINPIDFIKLDVQGAELEILRGGENVVDSVLGLEIEVEFIEVYKNQPLFGEIDAWVRSKGFILFNIIKVYNKRLTIPEEVESYGQLTWGDALYFKDVNHLFNESNGAKFYTTQLLKLAAITDLYCRPDYSLYVLERAAQEFPKQLGKDLEEVEFAISEIKSRLAETNQPENRAMDRLFERHLNGKFARYLSILLPKTFQRLHTKMEARKRGYSWREQSW